MLKKSQYHSLERRKGRINIQILALPVGGDLLVLVTGGTPHVGGIALAEPGGTTRSMGASGHKDDIPTAKMATRLAAVLNCRVAVTAGIHYDNATFEEIAQILELCDILTVEILDFYGGDHAGYENS